MDKADGKTKQKILGCIFTEKFENFDFESCNHIFTPEIKSIMLATNVLKNGKNKKEVKNDLLSMMAPPLRLELRTLWLTVRCCLRRASLSNNFASHIYDDYYTANLVIILARIWHGRLNSDWLFINLFYYRTLISQ